MVNLPDNFLSDLLNYIGQLFTDFSSLIALLAGLVLAFWAIREVILLVKENLKKDEEEDEEEEEEEDEEEEEEELTDDQISSFFNQLHEERGTERGKRA